MTFQPRTLLLAAATLFAGSAAYSETFVARFYHVQPIANTICDDYAFAWGQKFPTFVAGATVSDARCVPDEVGGEFPFWTIRIAYSAAAEVPMVNTYDDASIYHAGFDKRETCQTAVQGEAERFAKLTGLKVFSASCRVPLYKTDQWYVSVVGFGSPAVRPFESGVPVWGKVIGHSLETFTEMVRQGFTKMNLELARTTLKSDLAHSTLVMSYYAKDRVRFDATRMAIFSTKEACSAEVANASKALADAGVATLGTYCGAVYTNQIELTTLRNEASRITLSHSDKLYADYASCMQERTATADHYRNDLKRDIKASFCTTTPNPDTGKFHVVMIEKR